LDEGVQGTIRVTLKYIDEKCVITDLKRISKPGLRVYANASEMPRVLGGLGIAVVSTNKGLMTDRTARKENVGGEVLAYVW
jgi:small subunit ribosomal protein S8